MSKVNNEIAVQERREFGKNASRRARKAGQIPVSVYSKGKESRSFLIDADEWKVLSGHGAHMVTLLDGAKKIPALVKEVQFNYLKNYVLHVDFQEVDLNQEITDFVPIHAHGESVGAAHGGILEQELHELEVTKTDDPLNLDLCLSEDLEVSENFAKLQDNADNLLWLRHKCHQIAPTIEALLQDRLTKQGR